MTSQVWQYPNLWTGCVGAWCPSRQRFPASTLIDYSSNNNHGVLTNMDPATDWVASESKVSLDFDGTDEAVDISKSIVPIGSAAKTISMWVNSSAIATRQWLIYAGTETTRGRFCLEIISSKLTLNYWSASASHTQTLNSNQWYHVAVTYTAEQTSFTLSVNGQPQTFEIISSLTFNTGTTVTTRFGLFSSWIIPLIGKMDDMRIYNRSLGIRELQTLAMRRGIAYETKRRRSYKAGGGVGQCFNSGSIFSGRTLGRRAIG